MGTRTKPLSRKIILLNGASKDMDVNGAGTPVNFEFVPQPAETFLVEAVSLILTDGGNFLISGFGGLAALGNGLRIQIQSRGTLYEHWNAVDNADLMKFFRMESSVLSDKTLVGHYEVREELKLEGNSNDFFRAIVRDNLTGLNHLSMAIQAWRTI